MRWMPLSLIVLGLMTLAVLSVPLFEPSLFWAFAFNPLLTLTWDIATVVAIALILAGSGLFVARRVQARSSSSRAA